MYQSSWSFEVAFPTYIRLYIVLHSWTNSCLQCSVSWYIIWKAVPCPHLQHISSNNCSSSINVCSTRSFQSFLAVPDGLQASGGAGKGVWCIRARVWMSQLNHKACQTAGKANPKVIKTLDNPGSLGGDGPFLMEADNTWRNWTSANMPSFCFYKDLFWFSFIL